MKYISRKDLCETFAVTKFDVSFSFFKFNTEREFNKFVQSKLHFQRYLNTYFGEISGLSFIELYFFLQFEMLPPNDKYSVSSRCSRIAEHFSRYRYKCFVYIIHKNGLNVKLLTAHLRIVLCTKSIPSVRGFTSEIYHFFSIGKGLVRHIGIRQFRPTKIYVFCHSTFPDLSLFRFRNAYIPPRYAFFFKNQTYVELRAIFYGVKCQY